MFVLIFSFFFFFNDTATTEIYTLSLHDALPISSTDVNATNLAFSLVDNVRITNFATVVTATASQPNASEAGPIAGTFTLRSEEHTSELQSRLHLVCRLLLEKKKKKKMTNIAQTN